jgi:hypothetical protein
MTLSQERRVPWQILQMMTPTQMTLERKKQAHPEKAQQQTQTAITEQQCTVLIYV